jgi:hypothetical protein
MPPALRARCKITPVDARFLARRARTWAVLGGIIFPERLREPVFLLIPRGRFLLEQIANDGLELATVNFHKSSMPHFNQSRLGCGCLRLSTGNCWYFGELVRKM